MPWESRWNLGHNGEWSEEVDSVALLVGVGDELGVKFLVAGEADAFDLLVFLLSRNKRIRFSTNEKYLKS